MALQVHFGIVPTLFQKSLIYHDSSMFTIERGSEKRFGINKSRQKRSFFIFPPISFLPPIENNLSRGNESIFALFENVCTYLGRIVILQKLIGSLKKIEREKNSIMSVSGELSRKIQNALPA